VIKKTFTILIVDDDQEIGLMLKIMLEHKGYSVIILNNAENLHQALANNSVDVIILDMLIAGLKGDEICASLKQDSATAHYPVMIMTAMPDVEILCRQAGANEFIAKPFEMDILIAKINSLTALSPNN
jgi:DNA-binding response OmpR family regulator